MAVFFLRPPRRLITLPKTQPVRLKLATLNTPSDGISLPEMIKPSINKITVMQPPQKTPQVSLAPCQLRAANNPAAAAAAKLRAALKYAMPRVSSAALFAINAAMKSSGSATISHAAIALNAKLKLILDFPTKKTPPT